jgi:hypothetical protein
MAGVGQSKAAGGVWICVRLCRTCITKVRRMVDDKPRNAHKTQTDQTANQSPIPPLSEPTAEHQQHSRSDEQDAARHERVRTVAKRRHCIRRNRTIAFWIQFLAGCATIAIAGLTWAYVYYSGKQWGVMRDTLNYQIRQTQARLAVTNLTISNFPQAPFASWCIENDGHAMADEISVGLMLGGRAGRDPFRSRPAHDSFRASLAIRK